MLVVLTTVQKTFFSRERPEETLLHWVKGSGGRVQAVSSIRKRKPVCVQYR